MDLVVVRLEERGVDRPAALGPESFVGVPPDSEAQGDERTGAQERVLETSIVIDISEQAGIDRNYRLSVRDVLEFETQHGPVQPGTVVLLRTGWSQYWPNAKAYLGDDTPGDASKLQFPSYGAEAAKLLVEERQVVLLGVDTASIDYGQSRNLPVHRMVAAHNVSGLENLTALDQLPATGFVIIALPMKIEGGSGGPARVVALIPE